ncbi:MAG: cobalamin biosynthesis protein [Candidatus Omnitrophota bacterium]|nr:cobalamin biosynthesis protein [Candidatus Omnitrophota bacterium]
MRVAIVAITKKGGNLGLRIKKSLPASKLYVSIKFGNKEPETLVFKGKLTDLTQKLFAEFEGIVFCMAAGIAVRVIAPYIKNKHVDPAVVVVDEEGRFAISLLSGHEGGANSLAIRVANSLSAEPVITTASESQKKLVIGIGCRRGIDKIEIIKGVRYALTMTGCPMKEVRCIATIDLKQDEPGLQEACMELGVPLRILSRELIKKFNGKYEKSAFVKEKIGVEGVSEPCALIVARRPKLILAKTKIGRVTVAVAKEA